MSVVLDYITLKISSGKNVHCNIYNISISRGARISTHPSFHFITILCLNGSLHGETVLHIDGEYVVYDVRLLTTYQCRADDEGARRQRRQVHLCHAEAMH